MTGKDRLERAATMFEVHQAVCPICASDDEALCEHGLELIQEYADALKQMLGEQR